MKRKLFSMLFAACAALVSISGLTGCGGGGGDEQIKLGAMTLEEFGRCQRHFELDQAIRGYVGLTQRQMPSGSEFPPGTESVSGIGLFVADGGSSSASARMTYTALSGTDDEGNDLTGMYELKISFDSLNSTTDAGILAALGIANGGDGGTNISSELTILIAGSNFQAFCNVVTDLEGGEGEGDGEGGAAGEEGLSGVGTILNVKGSISQWAGQ